VNDPSAAVVVFAAAERDPFILRVPLVIPIFALKTDTENTPFEFSSVMFTPPMPVCVSVIITLPVTAPVIPLVCSFFSYGRSNGSEQLVKTSARTTARKPHTKVFAVFNVYSFNFSEIIKHLYNINLLPIIFNITLIVNR